MAYCSVDIPAPLEFVKQTGLSGVFCVCPALLRLETTVKQTLPIINAFVVMGKLHMSCRKYVKCCSDKNN